MRSGSLLAPDVVRAPGRWDDRVPVTVLTGFLGAGKTTLLNKALAANGGERTLVIVNEFGDTGLDHALMTHAHEDGVIELSGGCLCCSINGDLGRTLADAIWRFSRAGRRDFDRVVIETTGLSMPQGITSVLHRDFRVAAHYRLNGVVAVVDASNVLIATEEHPEVRRQIEGADRIVLTKTDLAPHATQRDARTWLEAINPVADVVDASCDTPFDLRAGGWRAGVMTTLPVVQEHGEMPTVSVEIAEPVDMGAFATWLDLLVATAGTDLLRLKGIVDVGPDTAPLAVHAVQGVAYPAVRLDTPHDVAKRTRLVLIGRALESPTVLGLIDSARALFTGCTVKRRGLAVDTHG